MGFAGKATDAEDGGLTAGLAWTDGAIGSGGSFSTLSVGAHTITAAVYFRDPNLHDLRVFMGTEVMRTRRT